MRARGREFSTGEPGVELTELATMTPNRLRFIAGLLEKDLVYMGLERTLSSNQSLTSRRWNSYLQARAERVRDFLRSSNPEKLVVCQVPASLEPPTKQEHNSSLS